MVTQDEVEASWAATIARVEVRLPFAVKIQTWSKWNGAEVIVRLCATVPDVFDQREMISVYAEERGIPPALEERQRLSLFRRMLRGLLLHELDEGFWVDGAQYVNPHPEVTKETNG